MLAWEILQQVEAGSFADALLGSRLLATPSLSPRDQGLATRLVYGTLAWQQYLDHLLAGFCNRSLAELDAPIRAALRLGMYQACVLSRIPEFAAIHTSVNLAKRHRGGMAAGFVNAVLRRAVHQWRGVPFPSETSDLPGHLSARLSHPRWLVERWLEQFGEQETRALLAANNEPAPTAVRVNLRTGSRENLLRRWSEAGWEARAGDFSPLCLQVEGCAPERLPGYEEGLFTVQGEASQLVGFLLAPASGQHILDACAAPGGKATHLAERMEDRGEVVALDVHERGTERIAATARRLGLTSVRPVTASVLEWEPPTGGFDSILVDAPCSGLGTLRQHPEARWRRGAEDVRTLAALQLRICLRVAAWLRPGGTLVYSTCTLTREENEQVVESFLGQQPEFRVEDASPFLPEKARDFVGGDGALRTFPHRGGLDGFFAVRLRRSGTPTIVRP